MIENGYENDFLDFKLELYDFSNMDKKRDFLVDIMSMANSNYVGDRYLIIGVRDLPVRVIKGINKKDLQDSATYYQFINENIEPSINFKILNIEYNGNDFVVYKIPYGKVDRPYIIKKEYNKLLKGTCNIRKGSQNSFITRYDLDNIYKSRISDKKSNLVVKNISNGELCDKLSLQQFNYDLEDNELNNKIKEKIYCIDKVIIDDATDGYLSSLLSSNKLNISKEDEKNIKRFLKENNINVNDNFFEVGDVGYLYLGIGTGKYTGSEKSIQKYELLTDLIENINNYYGILELKKELNKLYFVELVVCNAGNSHDELIDVTIKIPKNAFVSSEKFPIPYYEFLERYKGEIVNKYNPNSLSTPQSHIVSPSIPVLLSTMRESYESLK